MTETTISKEDIIETLYLILENYTPKEITHDCLAMDLIYGMAENHSREVLYQVTDIYCQWCTDNADC